MTSTKDDRASAGWSTGAKRGQRLPRPDWELLGERIGVHAQDVPVMAGVGDEEDDVRHSRVARLESDAPLEGLHISET
ncbi:MAG TPA: hypothetical protein VFI34_03485 [Candidatus Limnocylindrales bacterium]|nr:hypothetical protein [Candidatus Limnocylindrales bacterium]